MRMKLHVCLFISAMCWLGFRDASASSSDDPRIAIVQRGPFVESIRTSGELLPVSDQKIFSRLNGTLLQVVEDGRQVRKGDVLLQVDTDRLNEELARQISNLRRMEANWVTQRQNALKGIRSAQDQVESFKLLVDLEKLRLKDLEDGPSTWDIVSAETELLNAKTLLEALKDELEILGQLAAEGHVSAADLRQKEYEVKEQQYKVEQAEIAHKKLLVLDPIGLAEQRLKVLDQEKRMASANERVALLERNLQESTQRHKRDFSREDRRKAQSQKKIAEATVLAPNDGIALLSRHYWFEIKPGSRVYENLDLMTLSDLSKMKVVMIVDEARIARIRKDRRVMINVPGLNDTFEAIVTEIAEKGRDEFESYKRETRDITGKANRQVFDVSAELTGDISLLRPGLRVQAEIRIAEFSNVAIVPRASVIHESADEDYVRVAAAFGPERRKVKVLAENATSMAVEGVQPDEKVWVVQP